MKNITLYAATAGLLATSSSLFAEVEAGITYALPGMSDQATMDGMNCNETVDLGKHFEYSITGIEYQLGSGDTGSGYNNGNGKFKSNKTGSASLTVKVNGNTIVQNATLETNNINTVESASIDFDEPLIIENDNVEFTIEYSTDMPGVSPTFVLVKGASLKDPPKPSGSLDVAAIVRSSEVEDGGATPTVYWQIVREGVYAGTPGVEVDTGESDDAPNSDEGKTNNGHGNNLDGVDVSNPGKSAEKWAARGIIDESGSFDDEASGGGSAVSQQND